jgi:hypothetical protein
MQPKLITLPRIEDIRGNLTFIEEFNHIPFEMKRIYWIHDIPGGQLRGGHAFKTNEELVIALSGSFEVYINDGENEFNFFLNRSNYGIYVPKLNWRELKSFSTNSLALIISSAEYEESDYIRSFELFKELHTCNE